MKNQRAGGCQSSLLWKTKPYLFQTTACRFGFAEFRHAVYSGRRPFFAFALAYILCPELLPRLAGVFIRPPGSLFLRNFRQLTVAHSARMCHNSYAVLLFSQTYFTTDKRLRRPFWPPRSLVFSGVFATAPVCRYICFARGKASLLQKGAQSCTFVYSLRAPFSHREKDPMSLRI